MDNTNGHGTMIFTTYRLPDGRIVPVDASAAKGALVIGFTLVGGRVVEAIRVDEPVCAWCYPGQHAGVSHGICAAHAAELEG